MSWLTPSAKKACQVFGQLGRFSLLLHKDVTGRYWEIDALRGVAILMMITYHLAYDLALFGYCQVDVRIGPWRVFAHLTSSLFIFLLGVSLVLGRARAGFLVNGWRLYLRYLARGVKLVGWGLMVTLATWLYMDRVVVIFGILHLMGVATILAFPLLPFRWANLVIGSGIIGLDVYLSRDIPPHPIQPVLRVLGLQPPAVYEIDYFPLFPWFGVVLLGIFVGQLLYRNGRPRFRPPNLGGRSGTKQLTWLGRHSLLVYLLHQPFLIASLTLAGAVA